MKNFTTKAEKLFKSENPDKKMPFLIKKRNPHRYIKKKNNIKRAQTLDFLSKLKKT